MKPIIKVNFGTFWPDFNREDNYFTRILGKRFTVVFSENPDLYFFTHAYDGRRDYLKYRCHRVFLGWENERADWNICDYVLDSDYYINNPRQKRWPIWTTWGLQPLLGRKQPLSMIKKKKFACMVVSNGKARERIDFFQLLSKYKKVDSGGRFLNNIGGPVANKREFIKDYKFVLSFENSSYPGYTTEKLIEPMLVNSIPVYWGNPRVGEDFNTKSFIHINQFSSYKDAVDYIVELDKDDEKLYEMVNEPWFNENKVPYEMTEASLEEFFDFLLKDMKTKKPVGSSTIKTYFHRIHVMNKRIQGAFLGKLNINKGFR